MESDRCKLYRHDDPLDFDTAAFDASLTALIERVHTRPQTVNADAP